MSDRLTKALEAAAVEIAGWGGGNEAGLVRAGIKEIERLRTALAEQSRLNAEARTALAIIADMATGPTGHEANRRRQIADVARKAMEDGR